MNAKYQKIGEVKETHSLRVAARGNGLYLFLPKGLCEVHGIMAGDRLKVQLLDHYRPKPEGCNSSMKVLHPPGKGGESAH